MKDAYIRNIEYFLPPKKENNLKLLKILGKDKNFSNRIINKIGIKSRRICSASWFWCRSFLGVMSNKEVLINI